MIVFALFTSIVGCWVSWMIFSTSNRNSKIDYIAAMAYYRWIWLQTGFFYYWECLQKYCGWTIDYTSKEFIEKILKQEKWIPLHCKLESVTIEKDSTFAGFSGQLSRILLTYDQPSISPTSLLIKQISFTFYSRFTSVLLGTYREAAFYHHLGNKVQLNTPKILYTEYCKYSGRSIFFMEDLQPCVSVTPILGNQCYGKTNFPTNVPDSTSAITEIFVSIAKVHARHWCDKSLLTEEFSWLLHSDWWHGKGHLRYTLSTILMKNRWELIQNTISKKKDYSVKWSKTVCKLMEIGFQNSKWEKFQNSFIQKSKCWTLCHGDFHASNIVFSLKNKEYYVLDYPCVGVWQGATDIAQFAISNMTIEYRRKSERKFLDEYWNELSKNINTNYTFENFMGDYKQGGIERWLQMLLILASFNAISNSIITDEQIQWFHDQVEAFIDDHFDSNLDFFFCSGYIIP